MEPIYKQQFQIPTAGVDRYGRLKPSWILYYAQQVAGKHFDTFQLSLVSPEQKQLFWAVIRHRVQITRLPMENETITVETWPMPTTRVAYPRSTVAYDAQGNELFRSISLWVLMDQESRGMILPGKSGVIVNGTLRGSELAAPGSLAPKGLDQHTSRTVGFTELDVNGHVNNTRYLDWVADLLPSAFHQAHPAREFTVCYLSEVMETQQLDLVWQLQDGPVIQVDALRRSGENTEQKERVFSAQVFFE